LIAYWKIILDSQNFDAICHWTLSGGVHQITRGPWMEWSWRSDHWDDWSHSRPRNPVCRRTDWENQTVFWTSNEWWFMGLKTAKILFPWPVTGV
jgi:hypothetical protein